MKILTFGELLLRLTSVGYEKLFQSNTLNATFCGGEANVAVSLSIFGIHSCFVTKLPNNDVGKAAKRSLDYFGVDTSNIIFGDGRMGLFYLEKGASQRPSVVIYDRKESSIANASSKDFDWETLFNGVTWFHWTGISPAISPNVANIIFEACKFAKQKGIIVSCDLNYRRKLWSPEDAQKTMKQLLPFVDVCIGNEEDAQLVLGINSNYSGNNIIPTIGEYKKIASTIERQYGCKTIAFTLRESYSASFNGWKALLYNEGEIYQSQKYDIQLIDRVGAGDSFAAGLIFGLISGKPKQECIEFAAAASCLKQTIEGDFNRVSASDVYSLMSGDGNGRIKR